MWRETDSWFELRFVDGSKGYAHLNANGEYMAIYREDGKVLKGPNYFKPSFEEILK